MSKIEALNQLAHIEHRPALNGIKPDVKPYNLSQILDVLGSFADKTGSHDALDELIRSNQVVYDQAKTVTVYLNAKAGFLPQGWIGDMIEAYRLIPPILQQGKRVHLVTSHPELFEGVQNRKFTVSGVPENIHADYRYPWSSELLDFLSNKTDGNCVLFPMNAHMPAVFVIRNGTVVNGLTVDLVRQIVHPWMKTSFGIFSRDWAKTSHQLHALQIFAYMIGINSVSSWDRFPKPPIQPSHSAQLQAHNVIKEINLEKGQPVLFVHLGTASNSSKVRSKYYPIECWKQVFGELIPDLLKSNHKVLIMTPLDFQQASDSLNLIAFLNSKGVSQAELFPNPEKFGYLPLSLHVLTSCIDELKDRSTFLGIDSMPAGHLAPVFDIPTIVIGNFVYHPSFYCPPENAIVVLPEEGLETASDVNAHNVVRAVRTMIKK